MSGQEKEESFEVWCFSAKEAQSGSAIPDPLSMTSMVSSPLSLILISIDENDTEIAEFRQKNERSQGISSRSGDDRNDAALTDDTRSRVQAVLEQLFDGVLQAEDHLAGMDSVYGGLVDRYGFVGEEMTLISQG